MKLFRYPSGMNRARQSLVATKTATVHRLLSYLAIATIVGAFFFNIPVYTISGNDLHLLDALVFFYVFSFGLYRFFVEKNRYQLFRIHTIVWLYMIFWGILPYYYSAKVPVIGGSQTMWPGIHVIGSIMFFVYGFFMLFLGRRIDCGWNCPCVATRETVGFAFRDKTVRGEGWWRLRFLKYILLGLMLLYLLSLLLLPLSISDALGNVYYKTIGYSYYIGFIAIPFFGNRIYCRLMCPYAALWGIYSYLGFYRIAADGEKCTDCGLCEKSCDMGIPITRYIDRGSVRTVECMGCARCVEVCPKDALEIKSVVTEIKKRYRVLFKRSA